MPVKPRPPLAWTGAVATSIVAPWTCSPLGSPPVLLSHVGLAKNSWMVSSQGVSGSSEACVFWRPLHLTSWHLGHPLQLATWGPL